MNQCFCIGAQNGDQYCRCVMIEKGLKMNPVNDSLKYIFEQADAKIKKEKIAMKKWNAEADQYNQWSELGQDEKDELISKVKS